MRKEYYFISDLHIGGDEALGVCDFEDELINFMEKISISDNDTELLIVGDAFGLWEFTQVVGVEKINKLISQFPRIFETFKRVGQKIKITVLPGNHDYEIACYKEFTAIFAQYNVSLEQTPATTRLINGKKLWIEHGNQYDTTNRMSDFGNPYALPIGYFITSNMVGPAGQLSKQGRYNWLKDIQSVYPTEMVPDWVWSNYFYKEMSPVLRLLIVPFLLLSGLTTFVLIGSAFEYFNLTDSNVFLNNFIFESLGIVGSIFQTILAINAMILILFIVLAIPFHIMLRDLKRTLKRFGIEIDPAELTGEKEELYLDAAQGIFNDSHETAVFIYGHTHTPSLKKLNNRYVINTGTWLKQFNRLAPRFGLFPPIYVPFYYLNYFHIKSKDNQLIIEYHKIEKKITPDFTLLQRLIVSREKPEKKITIPERTVLNL